MTEEDYYGKRATEKTLDDLYRVAAGIDEKVEEILDELKDLVAYQSESASCGYSMEDYYRDHDLDE